MAIRRFFDKNIIVRRERELGSNKRGLYATATVDAHYQDLDIDDRASLGIVQERAWRFWFDVSENIQEGDLLVDSATGDEFRVTEVTTKNYGINQHLEVLALEANA